MVLTFNVFEIVFELDLAKESEAVFAGRLLLFVRVLAVFAHPAQFVGQLLHRLPEFFLERISHLSR